MAEINIPLYEEKMLESRPMDELRAGPMGKCPNCGEPTKPIFSSFYYPCNCQTYDAVVKRWVGLMSMSEDGYAESVDKITLGLKTPGPVIDLQKSSAIYRVPGYSKQFLVTIQPLTKNDIKDGKTPFPKESYDDLDMHWLDGTDDPRYFIYARSL